MKYRNNHFNPIRNGVKSTLHLIQVKIQSISTLSLFLCYGHQGFLIEDLKNIFLSPLGDCWNFYSAFHRDSQFNLVLRLSNGNYFMEKSDCVFDCQNSCCFFISQNSLLGPSLDFLPLAGLRITKYPQKVKLMVDSQCHFTTLSSAFKTCFYILFLWRETSVLSKMSVSGKKKKSVKFLAWSFNHFSHL